ncbi:hypothetical protein JET18_19405 [Chryseobacterium sp. L7]|uniref:Lipoprotein n=1 Tax=Chryseobacterium endalhagicum TaxID=2797638 RepID=A0ABS1QK89_9FLAO|nr:hypothetical protein [Chryseobacterium endalhagicum]MBL1223030.1 hypothetical protein [Chryseobacterium endalhagicum]
MTKRFLLLLMFAFLFMSCSGQENPEFIGPSYGAFDLDKITFKEDPDHLLSKVEKYYQIPTEKTVDGKIIPYKIYRILPEYVTEGMFLFRNLKIKKRNIVDFYVDPAKKLSMVEFSAYLTIKEYNDLLKDRRDFKDITPDNVRKFHNGKYEILQNIQNEKQIETTWYILKVKDENEPGSDYFLRVSIKNIKP